MPPTPREGEEKCGGDSAPPGEGEEDEDECPDTAEADELALHYDATVKPLHRGKGSAEILARLRGGEPSERLRSVAVAYANRLDAARKDSVYRQTAATFYGTGKTAKYTTLRDNPPRSSAPTAERNPDLVAAAQRIMAMYRQLVRSSHEEKGAEAAVIDRLVEGVSEQTLGGAAERYGRHCDRRRQDLEARKGAPAFFSSAWEEYRPPAPLPPYEPRSSLSREEFAARPHLATKSALVDEYFFKCVVGDDREGQPNLFVARILLDGVPPIELLAAAEGYARHAAEEDLPLRKRTPSPEFFVAEWQRWRTHPPGHWATEIANRLSKSEEQMEKEAVALKLKVEEWIRPQPVSVPARPVVPQVARYARDSRMPEEVEYAKRRNDVFLAAVRGGSSPDAALAAFDSERGPRPAVPTEPSTGHTIPPRGMDALPSQETHHADHALREASRRGHRGHRDAVPPLGHRQREEARPLARPGHPSRAAIPRRRRAARRLRA